MIDYVEEFIKAINEDTKTPNLQHLDEDGFWSPYDLYIHYDNHITPKGAE